MNVFDRNINFDALFKFSQMYVSMQSIDSCVVLSIDNSKKSFPRPALIAAVCLCRSHSTQVHLKNVYSSLAVCMFVAAAGSYVHVVTRLFQVRCSGVLPVQVDPFYINANGSLKQRILNLA